MTSCGLPKLYCRSVGRGELHAEASGASAEGARPSKERVTGAGDAWPGRNPRNLQRPALVSSASLGVDSRHQDWQWRFAVEAREWERMAHAIGRVMKLA